MSKLRKFVGLGAAALLIVAAGGRAVPSQNKPLDGQKVEVAAVWTGTEQKNFKKVLDAFKKKTGASVTFTSTGDDIAPALEPRIAGGNPPDVAVLPQPGLLRDFAQRGALRPIEDVAGTEVDSNYAPIWRELGSVDGQLYGVWFKSANKSLVWYNTKVFRDAGVQPATDFNQLLQDMKTIADSGVKPLSVGAANGWTLTDVFENVYLAQAGAEKYDQLAKHQIPWTDDSVKQALTTMGQIVQADYLPGGTSKTLQTEFPQSVQNLYASPPKAGVEIEADFVAGVISGDTKAKLGKTAKFFPVPGMSGGPAPVVTGGDVAVLFKDSEGGKELVKFLATPQAAQVWAKAGGYISANKSVSPNAYSNSTFRQIANVLVTSSNVQFDMSDQQPASFGATDGQGEWKIFQDFLRNPSDVDGTAQQLESAAAQAYAGG
ncbi:MAG TPA: ABC transporter substrate-binding protein [Acidimicrobiia bacterium]|nr:ABC transporter substrate-binding protein [Acidimicrobiia bacterium]